MIFIFYPRIKNMNKLDSKDVYTYDPCYNDVEEDMQGAQAWYKNGVFHRDGDQPAVVCANGTCKWYTDGLLHRGNDLPAVVSSYRREWYSHGVLHRENGEPAVIISLSLQGLDETVSNLKSWFVHGKLHRENDLPAVDGLFKHWFVIGKLHRETVDPLTGLLLPASIYGNVTSEYCLNGVHVNEHGKPI